MAILETDIKLLASERMTDDADGGGFMSAAVVADGVENNLFPDISEADRTFGRVQLRKVYLAVTSDDDDTFLGAHAILDEPPSDPAASALMVTKAGYSQERDDIVSALDNSSYKVATGSNAIVIGVGPYTGGVSTVIPVDIPAASYYWDPNPVFSSGAFRPGDVVGLFSKNNADPIPSIATMEVVVVKSVAASTHTINRPDGSSTSQYTQVVTLEAPIQADYTHNTDTVGLGDYMVRLTQDTGEGALTFFGQALTTAALDVADTDIPVDSSFAQYIPVAEGGDYPSVDPSVLGVNAAPYATTAGRVKIFRRNEAVVVHHTTVVAPQVVSDAQDINLGRTRLAKVRVFGDNGVEITAGFTVNKLTGHIVFTSVAGYSQPVTITHRIEDMLLVRDASADTVSVFRGVTHAFPSGSKVSSVMMFGDLQARVHDGWAQATWTNVWSDALIGSAPIGDFNQAVSPIVTTNAGGITERWAVIFTNSTSFRVVGEQVGEVVPSSSGSTGSDTGPLNPATGEPYFTIPQAGWGGGWAAGNVFRFNTNGANAPIWLIRSIAPSDPYEGQDRFTVALRGNVDA